MSWLFSQALVEAYWGEPLSAGGLSAQSSATSTPRAYLLPVKTTDYSHRFPYGMTCERSTVGVGAAVLTSFLAAFPVRISRPLAGEQESPEREAGSGWKWRESSVKYDPVSRSWKTRQCSLLGDSEWFSETWPRWGSMRDGESWELPMSARPIFERGSGLLPTIRSTDGERGGRGDLIQAVRGNPNSHYKMLPTPTKSDGSGGPGNSGRTGGLNLRTAAAQWPTPHGFSKDGPSGNELGRAVNRSFPTPTATDGKGPNTRSPGKERPTCDDDLPTRIARFPTPRVPSKTGGGTGLDGGSGARAMMDEKTRKELTGGSLNPTWVEWLMGWPLGWTDLKPLATDKCRNAQPPLGAC